MVEYTAEELDRIAVDTEAVVGIVEVWADSLSIEAVAVVAEPVERVEVYNHESRRPESDSACQIPPPYRLICAHDSTDVDHVSIT